MQDENTIDTAPVADAQVDIKDTNILPDTKEADVSEEEYIIKCPDYIPAEEVEAHTQVFKGVGIDAQTAQKVVDQLVSRGEQQERLRAEALSKSLEADKQALISELGDDYVSRERDISHYFSRENISNEDVQTLIASWGYSKTFKFFDRYAQQNKETSAGDTFTKPQEMTTNSSSDDLKKTIDSPEFYKRLQEGDVEAHALVKQWAKQQAQLD